MPVQQYVFATAAAAAAAPATAVAAPATAIATAISTSRHATIGSRTIPTATLPSSGTRCDMHDALCVSRLQHHNQ